MASDLKRNIGSRFIVGPLVPTLAVGAWPPPATCCLTSGSPASWRLLDQGLRLHHGASHCGHAPMLSCPTPTASMEAWKWHLWMGQTIGSLSSVFSTLQGCQELSPGPSVRKADSLPLSYSPSSKGKEVQEFPYAPLQVMWYFSFRQGAFLLPLLDNLLKASLPLSHAMPSTDLLPNMYPHPTEMQ